jgi:hypothetical protein
VIRWERIGCSGVQRIIREGSADVRQEPGMGERRAESPVAGAPFLLVTPAVVGVARPCAPVAGALVIDSIDACHAAAAIAASS